nr:MULTISPECIES: hypothetical protein [unclassified Streptomyces]
MTTTEFPAADFAAAQWTRATGAGVDPHEYRRVTDGLASVADWGRPSTAPHRTTSGARRTRGHPARPSPCWSPVRGG